MNEDNRIPTYLHEQRSIIIPEDSLERYPHSIRRPGEGGDEPLVRSRATFCQIIFPGLIEVLQ
jgi:hypothetical protein